MPLRGVCALLPPLLRTSSLSLTLTSFAVPPSLPPFPNAFDTLGVSSLPSYVSLLSNKNASSPPPVKGTGSFGDGIGALLLHALSTLLQVMAEWGLPCH